jgi:hypothetical protein
MHNNKRFTVERLDRRVLLAALTADFPFPSGESDFGDAPDSYGTLRASNGPVHEVAFAEIRLGANIDIEGEGIPSTNALGDDADNLDDEDGVAIPQAFEPGAVITVVLNVANERGMAMGWIDFDRDGKFDGSEQVIDAGVNPGNNTFSIQVPGDAAEGFTYARFRVSNEMIPGPNGVGAAGEVEDYRVRIEDGAGSGQTGDFGDAPDSYGTTLARDGARHAFEEDLFLGKSWDDEANGQPTADADGDDASGSDDEDGVQFSGNFLQGRTDDVLVEAGKDGFLSVWLDLEGDGTFDSQDLVFQGGIKAGETEIEIDVPSGANDGQTYMRFRFSDQIVNSPIGPGGVGEVEDYLVEIDEFVPPVTPFDYGDAPNFPGALLDYPTLLASDGARHSVDPNFSLGFIAGDLEPDGQHGVSALGDDNDPGLPDDEDGVDLPTFAPGLTNAMLVTVLNNANFIDARLDAWFDWNRDGDWDDAGEHAVVEFEPNTGVATYTVPVVVPSSVVSGESYARFRLSRGNGAVSDPRGFGGVGEVEDHVINIGRTSPNAANPVVVRPSSYLPRAARLEGLPNAMQQVISYHQNSGLAVDINVIGGPNYRLWSGGAEFGIVPDLGGDATDLLQLQALPGSSQRVLLPAEDLEVNIQFGNAVLDATNLIVDQASYSSTPTIMNVGTGTLQTDVTLLTETATAAGEVVRVGGLTIGDGLLVTLDGPGDTTWEFPGQTNQSDTGLTVRSGGQLDVADQVVLLSDATQGLDYAVDRIASAYAGNTWSGTGITSSLAGGTVSLGYGTAPNVVLDSTLGLTSLGATDVLIAPTVVGDANLDRTVDLADFTALRNNFGSGDRWAQADFNYDGVIDLADFTLLRNNFGSTYTPGAYTSSLFDE